MKKLLLAISAVLALVLVLASCGNGTTESNPFKGNWSGTARMSGQTAPATISVTDSSWTFRIPLLGSMSGTGTYTYSGNNATLAQNGVHFGTASVSGGTLTVNITSGAFRGATGTFTK
jgi:uncharacterized lipoprotein YehR (DUF1307 family)